MSRNTWIMFAVVIVVAIAMFSFGSNSRNPSECPTTAQEAVKLFGGRVSAWSQVDGGWMVIATSRTLVTIPSWFSRLSPNPDGTISFTGAGVIQQRVTLTAGQSLTIFCPLR